MAPTDIAFRNFLSRLSPEARELLLDIAERLAAVIRQGRSNTNAPKALATAMPWLSADERKAMLLCATKQVQETQMSFNLQYLQLQSQMQNENRSYTAVSNIMKTRHDTVRNSIPNIR